MLSPDEILARIDALPTPPDKERDYIGASEIGHQCTRYLWLKFHRYTHPKVWEPRMLRLFQRGKDEEYKFQAMLECIGFKVIQGWDDQAGFATGFFKGHGDGLMQWQDVKAIAEYKTHSKKSFDTLKPGTLSLTFPKHYAQAQVYMGKFGASYAIYMAVCKDDDRLFCDVIEFNQTDYDGYCAKADYIATSDKPPERVASKPTAFDCKFCDAHSVCWGLEMPRVDCRNCTSSTKDQIAGVFGCELQKPWVGGELNVCPSHSWNPFAVQDMLGWSPVEFYPDQRAVKYQKPDGTILINGAPPFGVPSGEVTL